MITTEIGVVEKGISDSHQDSELTFRREDVYYGDPTQRITGDVHHVQVRIARGGYSSLSRILLKYSSQRMAAESPLPMAMATCRLRSFTMSPATKSPSEDM